MKFLFEPRFNLFDAIGLTFTVYLIMTQSLWWVIAIFPCAAISTLGQYTYVGEE